MTRYAAHLKELFTNEIEGWIARSVPLIIRRSLESGLHGVWAKGDWDALPPGGLIIAANHHSWWDGYLLWLVKRRTNRPICLLMEGRQLERFRFFRYWGAIDRREVREALRRLERGDMLFIFPEGRLEPTGKVVNVHRGLEFLATQRRRPHLPARAARRRAGGAASRGVCRVGTKARASHNLGSLPGGGERAFVGA